MYFMFENHLRKYFRYAQMTSFIFVTIIEFSAAIGNVYAQLVLMNRGLTSTYIMLIWMLLWHPLTYLFPRGTRVLVSPIIKYLSPFFLVAFIIIGVAIFGAEMGKRGYSVGWSMGLAIVGAILAFIIPIIKYLSPFILVAFIIIGVAIFGAEMGKRGYSVGWSMGLAIVGAILAFIAGVMELLEYCR